MKYIQLKLLCLLLLSASNLKALDSTVFNGKKYYVYPHEIHVTEYYDVLYIEHDDFNFQNYLVPPIIGNFPDGDYVIKVKIAYTNDHYKRDTIDRVYATFTLINNKKNGSVELYESHQQEKPYVSLPYKDDVIHGDLHYIQSFKNNWFTFEQLKFGKSVFSSEQYDYILSYTQFCKFKFDLHFVNGLPFGEQKCDLLNKKDIAYPLYQFDYKNGVLDGNFKHYAYKTNSRKKLVKNSCFGQYSKGQKTGKWQFVTDEKKYKETTYVDGKLNSIYLFNDGKLSNKFLFGLDSLKLHVPNYKSDKKLPLASTNQLRSKISTELFDLNEASSIGVLFSFSNGQNKIAYYIKDSVSRVFYDVVYDLKDTVVNGHLLFMRSIVKIDNGIEDYFNFKSYLSIDTVVESPYSEKKYKYILKQIFIEYKQEKHSSIEYNIYDKDLYYKIFKNPLLLNKYKEGNMEVENYYHSILKFEYYNFFVKLPQDRVCKLYNEIIGPEQNTLIRHLLITNSRDSVRITDTLYNNGVFLYPIDKEFYSNYSKFNILSVENGRNLFRKNRFSNKMNKKSLFYRYLMQMFSFETKIHRGYYLNDQLFDGELDVEFNYKTKPNEMTFYTYEYYVEFEGVKARLRQINLYFDILSDYNFEYNDIYLIPYRRIELRCNNSILNGSVEASDVFFETAVTANYTSNTLHGDFKYKLYDLQKFIDTYNSNDLKLLYKHNFKRKDFIQLPTRTLSYKTGKLNGSITTYQEWQIENLNQYKEGKLNGVQYCISGDESPYMNYIYYMTNDTIDGEAKKFFRNGKVNEIAHFNHGKLDGSMKVFQNSFLSDSSISWRLNFTKGYLDGQFQEYSFDDVLIKTIDFKIRDSNFVSLKSFEHTLMERNLINSESETFELNRYSEVVYNIYYRLDDYKGYHTYYYDDGVLFCSGAKDSGKKVGLWTYYRIDGKSIYKKIYKGDTVLRNKNSDSFTCEDYVRCYYDNGQLMYEGFTLSYKSQVVCESQTEMPISDMYYLQFYDTSGSVLLINGTGFITELQSTGYKLREGNLVNYHKEGVWIEYNIKGLPIEMGMYKNGKKEGRWLTGDLSGLNVGRDICFADADEFTQYLKEYGGDLELGEEYYVNGVLINSNEVNTVKR